MTHVAVAPGKIILSGEYAVVFGHRGIAIPSTLMMTVKYDEGAVSIPNPAPLSIVWPGANEQWINYVRNIARMCECTNGTLTIETDLPLGKGMGSSTALVVAMARCFGADQETALEMEDAMNPGNSGLDFAVIWGGAPVLFRKGEKPVTAAINLSFMEDAVLINSGMPNETTPELVAWVTLRQAQGDTDVLNAIDTIARCTDRLVDGESPLTVIPDHHRAQIMLGVVPEKTQELIKKIEQSSGLAKVIGAGGRTGGGGVVLARHTDPKTLVHIAEERRMAILT